MVWISCSLHVYALSISEIMYDPVGSDTSREWIEIYNDTHNTVDITSWKFFENGINHGITSYSGGSILSSYSYAVIVDNPTKFLEDYPNYHGAIYDSTFSLSNSGEHIALKEFSSGGEVDSVDYNITIGGSNDGSTLSKIDGIWVRGEATPGTDNHSSLLSNAISESTTTQNQNVVAQATPPSADIVLYIPHEKVVVAGSESSFSVFGLTRLGKNIENITYTWAYGDGGQGVGSSTLYRYAYPGTYILQVEGTNGYVIGVGRMVVRVIAPDIVIKNISTGKYGTYIDILNPNKYDLDFSQWRISIDGITFPFPKNTILMGNGITHISGIAMGFASTTIATSSVIKILFPNMEEVTRYSPEEKNSINSVVKNKESLLLKVIPTTKIHMYSPVRTVNVATSTLKYGSTSQVTQLSSKDSTKDKRIATFFKSLFTRK